MDGDSLFGVMDREIINVCFEEFSSFYCAEIPWSSINQQKTDTAYNCFGIDPYAFMDL